MSTILQAINAVMKEVGYVRKQKSPDLSYTFAGEAALISALRPSMVEQGIVMYVGKVYDVVSREYASRSGAAMMNVTLTADIVFEHGESDTHITVQARGEASDNSDKANNKAMTCAYKYALRETFMIETGDDPDNFVSERASATAQAERQEHAEEKATVQSAAFDRTALVVPLDGKTVARTIAQGLFENPQAAATILAQYPAKKAPLGKILDWCAAYRKAKNDFEVSSPKGEGSTEAAIQAANATLKGE